MSSNAFAPILAKGFEAGRRVTPQAADIPSDMDAAERVQDEMIAALGPVAAWKVGAAARAGREQMGLPRMFVGALPAYRVFPSGAVVRGPWESTIGVESEYAYKFVRDLAAGGQPCDLQALTQAIGSVHAAFEIPASRFSSIGAHGSLALVADNGSAGWLVVGEGNPIQDWTSLVDAPVELSVDGKRRASGSAAGIDGMPLDVVLNFVHILHRRGHGIRAGQYVVTGSCTGYEQVPLGVPVRARFSALGQVEATFAAND